MKKLVCIALALCLWLTGVMAAVASRDVNQDGATNAVDALLVLQHAVGKVQLTQEQKILADGDENGVIDAADALLILQKSVDPTPVATPYVFDASHYVRHANRDFAETQQTVLCCRAEQLAEQLNQLQLRPEDQAPLLAAYGEEYFATHDLLLAGFLANSSEVTVGLVSLTNNGLGWQVEWQAEGSGGFLALEPRLYWIELAKS